MSPDPENAGADPSDPQTWNAYAYTRNNPTTNVDPDGLDCVSTSDQTSTSVTVSVTGGDNCSAGETYVAGTVDMSSLTYNGTTVGYGYTPYNTNQEYTIGTNIYLGPTISDSAVATLSSVYQQTNGPVNFFAAATFSFLGSFGVGTFMDSFSLPMSLGLSSGEAEEGGAATGASQASTGRTAPANLKEQLAMQQAKSNPAAGQKVPITMNDPRWPASQGWVKMQQNVNGVTVHYDLNTVTGETADWKFK